MPGLLRPLLRNQLGRLIVPSTGQMSTPWHRPWLAPHLYRAPLLASIATAILIFFVVTAAARDALPEPLAAAKRVLFLGDSITYGGTYVDFVEAALRSANPQWTAEVLALGLPSETVSGLSEPGHAGGRFPRPVLRTRLERTLAQVKPDVVLACYGMNDGIYMPWSKDRFSRYEAGILQLREQVHAAGAKLIHVTPPVFDALPIKDRILPAGLDQYSAPFAGYDEVLARYSSWLLSMRAVGWQVIDVHGPLSAAVAKRREAQPAFTFSKDGIHPDRAGHAQIAAAILTGLGLSEEITQLPLRWANEEESATLRRIRERRKLLADAWLSSIGHERPGMTPGLPLDEAQRKAAEL